MAAEALPAPITMVRPLGGGGKCGGKQSDGCAAATAASNIWRSTADGVAGCAFWSGIWQHPNLIQDWAPALYIKELTAMY
jgi:hypothetical protein